MNKVITVANLTSAVEEELITVSGESTLYTEEVRSLDAAAASSKISHSQEEYEAALRSKELEQVDQIITARKTYADRVFVLVRNWLIGIGLILLAQGIGTLGPIKFSLSDNVLMALIGGTTLNVIGIFTIVANFLFPKNGHSFFSRDFTRNERIQKSSIKPASEDSASKKK